jgi:hypothetical protein
MCIADSVLATHRNVQSRLQPPIECDCTADFAQPLTELDRLKGDGVRLRRCALPRTHAPG